MLKKLNAFIIALILLFVIMPCGPVAAAVIGQELLSNGGVEEVSDVAANGFGAFGGWGGDYISLTTTAADVHDGSYAVKYVTNAGGNPYISQEVGNLPGGGIQYKYKIGFWYKGIMNDSSGFTVKFEQYGPSGHLGDVWADVYTTARRWTYVEFEFYAHPDATRMIVMPRLMSQSATVFVDDISFKLVGGPEQFMLDTDWVFYYQNYGEATVTLTMDDFYEDTGYTVDFKLSRDEETLLYNEGFSLTDNKLTYKMDISALDKKTEYILSAVIKDSGGAVVHTVTQPIYRIDRPTVLTEDGVYMKDGKPFNPVMLYHGDMNQLEEACEGGINVVQWNPLYNINNTAKLIEELDYMESVGVMAAVVCYFNMKPAGHADNAESVKKVIAEIKDHPAVFCYMVMDEPFSHFENAEELLRESYKIIRTIDDVHPVYLCEDQKDKYPVSAKYVDCLGIDPYPGDDDYGRHVAEMTLAAREGVKYEKPVYNILQSFTFKSIKPTAQQLRAMTYQAYMAGAQGIGYYPWIPDSPELDDYLNKGVYWEGIVSFDTNDKPLFDAYYGRGEMKRFNIYRDDDIWYESFTDGEVVYTAVLNRTEEEKSVTVPLVSTNEKICIDDYNISVINGGSSADITKHSGSFTAYLPAYGAVLYKVTPLENTDFSLVNCNVKLTIAEEGDAITVMAQGAEKGDRIYIATYYTSYDTERLIDISAATCKGGIAPISCSAVRRGDDEYVTRLFLWTRDNGPGIIKTIE